jgi:uncharacterized protein
VRAEKILTLFMANFTGVEKQKKYTNFLAKEKSPYLLQHAHNPVNWYAWNDETLKKAKDENKLILVSIGYSACHWCHVMEHESFEDEQVAALMNEFFINIKVDREERPDIDQVYMSAVQIMTGHGGWPLNCFALPDGRPLYGGTYFPKAQWINILRNLAGLWKENKDKALEYASELIQGMQHVEKIERNAGPEDFSMDLLTQGVKKWKPHFDKVMGGAKRAPKFPMPNNWLFLLRFAHFANDTEVKKHVHLTLDCMANGGIYDHIGGGFARYSTDMDWKVPHFEKMLYDNAQLVSLYSEAYIESKKEQYREIVYETFEFIEREMTSPDGGFYSALDADSEGEEGKFYVWEEEELKELIGTKDFGLFAEVFSVNETGYWEDEKYILLKSAPLHEIAVKNSIEPGVLKEKITGWKKILLQHRDKRIRPGLDDKVLASWNALMIKGLCDAYVAFGDKRFLDLAERSAAYFVKTFLRDRENLFHASKDGQAYINGFLEDYAFTIQAFLSLFSVAGNEEWFDLAQKLTNTTFEKFLDQETGMFFFTSSDDEGLVVRKIELSDNVIPASTSQMARNLQQIYRLTGNSQYRRTAAQMLNNVRHEIPAYPSGYTNWGLLLLEVLLPGAEIAIVGKNVDEINKSFRQHYLPNAIFAYSGEVSAHPLFKNRFVQDKTLIYVCRNQACNLPVETIEEALEQI